VTLKTGVVVNAARLIAVAEGEDAGERAASDPSRCSTCASEIDLGATPAWRWCPSCASPLVAGGQHRQSRRTLTAVFGDLRPIDRDAHDADAIRLATVAAFDGLRMVLERHGATVEKFIGDAVMAVFGPDRRQEDDAVRAVRAAVEMQQYLAANPGNVPLELRIGVNTGPVIAGDPRLGQRLVTGDAVNVAARLEQTAETGQVVIGGLTRRLVGNAVTLTELAPLTLKGKSEPVPAYRVERIRTLVSV
jgi:class 3 adenylate cyclase